VELRSQFETECADHDRCRTFWLKGKNCIGSEKNGKLAQIAISVEVRSQLETERADRDEIQGELFELKQKSEKFFLAASKIEFLEVVNNSHKPGCDSLLAFFDFKQNSEKYFLAAQKFQFPEAVEKKEWTELTTLAQQVGAREKNQKNFLAEPKIEFSEVATILSQLARQA
jgi:hypothetical protein